MLKECFFEKFERAFRTSPIYRKYFLRCYTDNRKNAEKLSFNYPDLFSYLDFFVLSKKGRTKKIYFFCPVFLQIIGIAPTESFRSYPQASLPQNYPLPYTRSPQSFLPFPAFRSLPWKANTREGAPFLLCDPSRYK